MRPITSAQVGYAALLPSGLTTFRVLAASTAEDVVVPSGAKYARVEVMGSGTIVYAKDKTDGVAATVPAADVAASIIFGINAGHPRIIDVKEGQTLSIISAGTPVVQFEWYS